MSSLLSESEAQIPKGSLGLSTFAYKDLAWRVDVELAKRSLLVNSDPKYLLRLDLVNYVEKKEDEKTKSFHLESDYANMKLLKTELQKAVDEYNNTHCQRIQRYIA